MAALNRVDEALEYFTELAQQQVLWLLFHSILFQAEFKGAVLSNIQFNCHNLSIHISLLHVSKIKTLDGHLTYV